MSLFPAEMQSKRLRYEQVTPETLDPLELYKHVRAGAPHIEKITRYVTWEPYDHPKQAVEWIQECADSFEASEGATYALRPREGDRAREFAGIAGINPDWERRRTSLGTWLRKPFWGRGYSGERAGRVLELAFDRLGLDVVTVSHDPANENSQRAIERYVNRFGGHREGRIRNDTVMNGEPRDSVRYSISREEWRAATER